jgi:hypothetical protein
MIARSRATAMQRRPAVAGGADSCGDEVMRVAGGEPLQLGVASGSLSPETTYTIAIDPPVSDKAMSRQFRRGHMASASGSTM